MKASRKTYYIVNFILLFAVLITSFIVATVIMYQDQKNTALSKSELLTEQVQDDVNEKLKLADMLSRTVFLNEEFQNLAADVYTGDEVIADIYDHFNLLISIDDFFKNVLYIPRNATGDLDVENCVSLGYGLGYEYVQYNLPNLIETAQQPNHAKGGAFLSKLYYLDGKKVAYYALGRNIYDIRDGSYLNKMGVGVLFVDGNELTGMLNKYSMALDGLDFCVEENGEVLLSSDGYKNNASSKTGYWRKTVDMEEFSWTIVGVYDKSNIWDAMKDNFTVLVVIMAIAGASCCVLAVVIKRKSSQSFDYLFNAFSDLQHSNQIEPVPHSDDKEVNQVIDSFNRLTGSLKNLNDEMLKQKNRELKLELRNTEYMLNSLHSQINKHIKPISLCVGITILRMKTTRICKILQ